MKKLIIEDGSNPLEEHIGERLTFFCGNYIYTGKLMGVNTACVLLQEAGIVYETGELTDTKWKDMQKLPGDWYVQLAWIESFGVLKV